MSRHRIVRTMDYNDEYDGYDDVYGHSVDDDSCISPSDASQWIYDRARGQQSMSAFMANNKNIEEEDESETCEQAEGYDKKRRDSENFQMPVLDDLERAKLTSCIDEIRNVIGDSVSDRQIVETAMKYEYDVAKALDVILNASASARSQEPPRTGKEQIEKDFKGNLPLSYVKITPAPNSSQSSDNQGSSKLHAYIKKNFPNAATAQSKPIFAIPQLKPADNNTESCSPKLTQLIQDNISSSSSSTSQCLPAFNIPKLGSGSLTTSSPFTIPKLGASTDSQLASSSGSPSNHELLLKKIMESKKLKQQELQKLPVIFDQKLQLIAKPLSPEIITDMVDLTTALSTNSPPIRLPSHDNDNFCSTNDPAANIKPFRSPIVDCDLPSGGRRIRKPFTYRLCHLDLSAILKENLTKFKADPTNFGKVLILKYRCRNIPYVLHAFQAKHPVARFQFETQSPDDKILSHLNNKNKI